MKTRLAIAACMIMPILYCITAPARAGLVYADFNDCVVGSLGGPSNEGRGGIGFSEAQGKWGSGTSVILVDSGDLEAPAGTNYGIVQPVAGGQAPRRVYLNYTAAITRQQHRDMAVPLAGNVWGSFLVLNTDGAQMAGLTFNDSSGNIPNPSATGRWLAAQGTSLVIYKTGGGAPVTVANVFTLGETALVVFRYNTTAKRLDVWVNPALPPDAEGMDTLAPAYSSGGGTCDIAGTPAGFTGTGSEIRTIGIVFTGSADAGNASGYMDSLRLSDTADGYYEVAGLPAPPRIPARVVSNFNGYVDNLALNHPSQPENVDTGFSAAKWEDPTTGVPFVVAGDLSAPSATHYGAPQTGNGRSFQSRAASAVVIRQQYRAIEPPALAGTVWGSFLVQQTNTADSGGEYQMTGLTFNLRTYQPQIPAYNNGKQRIYATGPYLEVQSSDGAAERASDGSGTPLELFTAGQASLVLFRFDTATKQLDVWVDPALTPTPGALPAPVYSNTCDIFGTANDLSTIGVGGNTMVDFQSGMLDAIRLDDTADGYYAVTGLAEPQIVIEPASIVTPLQPQSVTVGGDAIFTVEAAGTAPLTYTWYKDDDIIAGSTTASHTITGAQTGDAGIYKVVVDNIAGQPAESSATLTVTVATVPASITTGLTDQTVMAGGDVVFTVEAAGTAPLIYTWYKDGEIIAGATTASHAITGAQTGDAGIYKVVVDNAAGQPAESSATLTVNLPPPEAPVVLDFNDYDGALIGFLRDLATVGTGFAAEAWGPTTSTIRIVGDDLSAPASTNYGHTQDSARPRSMRAIFGAEDTPRQLTRALEVALSGEIWGSFLIRQTHGSQVTGMSFNSEVSSNIPAAQRIYAEGTSLVIVPASGAGAVTEPDVFTLGQTSLVLVRYDTATDKLDVWVDPALPENVSGLDSVAPAHTSGGTPFDLIGLSGTGHVLKRLGVVGTCWEPVGGLFYGGFLDAVRFASGEFGYYEVIGLHAIPVITAQPVSTGVIAGDTITLSVAAHGRGQLAYQWTFNGTPIAGATSPEYTITGAQAADAGDYRVIVSNVGAPGSIISDAATVGIYTDSTPPAITAQPEPLTVRLGDPASFTVAAASPTPLTYQWRHDGNPIATGTAATLTIDAATFADQGAYDVIVANPFESVSSATAALVVVAPITIIAHPQDVASYAGGGALFTVEAAGDNLSYQWKYNGSPLAGETSASLSLDNLAQSQAGSYSVVVGNGLDEIESSAATLTVETAAPPLSGTITGDADASIENGPLAATNFNGRGLGVAALGPNAASRKAYLAFELPLAIRSRDATAAALRLTLAPAPLAGASPAGGESFLGAAAASAMRSDFPDSNQSTLPELGIGSLDAARTFRALLAFDAASLPAGAAPGTLRLTLKSWDTGGSPKTQILRLHRVTRDWSEPNVNWNRSAKSTPWAAPGGDYETELLGSIALDSSALAAGSAIDFHLTGAFSQALADAAASASGMLNLIVIAESEDGASGRNFLWVAGNAEPGLAPALIFAAGVVQPVIRKNPLRLRLHGIVDNSDTWDETALTWDNAPANPPGAIASAGAGAVPLAELTIDTATAAAGQAVTFSDARIPQFLNWAAGRRGDLHGNGSVSDTDRRVTFIITALDGGPTGAGVQFADKEAGPATAPALDYETGPASPPQTAVAIENERYHVTLRDDLAIDVTDKATDATATFAAGFEAFAETAAPGLNRKAYTYYEIPGRATNHNLVLPTWNDDHNYANAPGARIALQPAAAAVRDNRIVWRYDAAGASANLAAFTASLDLPAGDAAPRLRWTLAPSAKRNTAVTYAGLPALPKNDIAGFFMPGPWNGLRFPASQFMIDELRATLPAVLRKAAPDGPVAGFVVDPFEMPNRLATINNSLFGLSITNGAGDACVPAIHAPIYGGAGSATGGAVSFAVRLVVRAGDIDAAIRDVATRIYGFSDYRQNLPGGSLNAAIDNIMDFVLDETVDPSDGLPKGYSYWRANEKANEYTNDNPDQVRFQSAPTALSIAMVLDDSNFYEKRALPTIEYFISRSNDQMKFTGYDPAIGTLNGPVKAYYSTDFYALSALTGARTHAYLPLAEDGWAVSRTVSTALIDTITPGQALSREDAFNRAFDTLHSLIQAYRATDDAAYLDSAKWLSDEYIRHRYDAGPPADYYDARNSFWLQISGRWESLLEMYDLTGETRYADNAARAMDEYIRHVNFSPALSDLTVDAVTAAAKASAVSEVGLTCEAADTSASHRAIFMSAHAAPSMMRLAGIRQDDFLAAVGRSGIIGRWLNYPGYTMLRTYYEGLQRADYPLRWYRDYQNTAHMNHPLYMVAIAIDFLMAEVEAKTAGAIRFPHQFSDSRTYYRGRIFGGAPGIFHDDTNVWPWMPKALVSLSGADAVQLNYIAGQGNGRLYLAFTNQSQTEVTATINLRADKVRLTPGARMRIWKDNAAEAAGSFENGVTTVTVSPGGITAIAIDDARAVLDLQAAYQTPEGAPARGDPLPETSFNKRETAAFGRVAGAVLSLSPGRQSAYVYTAASPDQFSSMTLTCSIDDGPAQTLAKDAYPFEFTVPLPAGAQTFTYTLSGGGVDDDTITLTLEPLPMILEQTGSLDAYTGSPVILSVTTDDPGGLYAYQWLKDDEIIPGADGPTLILSGVMADAGDYQVIVSKGFIRAYSETITVTMLPRIVTIVTQPEGRTLDSGTPWTLSVEALFAQTYQWYKNGAAIPGATSASLILVGASYEAGDYYVVAENAESSATSDTVTIVVNTVPGSPVITAQPSGISVKKSREVVLAVAAENAVSYQWLKDGEPVPGATAPTLTLAGSPAESGTYHVRVTNASGSTVSLPALVVILPEPAIITAQPVDATVEAGVATTLAVTANPDAEYQWYKDGKPIPGAISATLDLPGLPSDAGSYHVVVTTRGGIEVSDAVTVTITPGPDSVFPRPSALAADAAGVLYVADAANNIIHAISGTRSATVFASGFASPSGLAVRSGTLYIADTGANSIRTVNTNGAVTVLAGPDKKLSAPAGIAVDSSGNLYVADSGNHVIRKITAAGDVSTLAGALSSPGATDAGGTLARFDTPAGVALGEAAGTLYIADTGNHAIRALALATGSVTTLAGSPAVPGGDDGPGASARFRSPGGMIVDGEGDIYLADTGNSLIRKITPAGLVTTIAGHPGIDEIAGVPGFKDGSGTNAWFNHPAAVALSPDGALYVADTGNKAIRRIDLGDNVTTLSVTATTSGTTSAPPSPGGGGGGGGGGATSLWMLLALAAIALVRKHRRSCR